MCGRSRLRLHIILSLLSISPAPARRVEGRDGDHDLVARLLVDQLLAAHLVAAYLVATCVTVRLRGIGCQAGGRADRRAPEDRLERRGRASGAQTWRM